MSPTRSLSSDDAMIRRRRQEAQEDQASAHHEENTKLIGQEVVPVAEVVDVKYGSTGFVWHSINADDEGTGY